MHSSSSEHRSQHPGPFQAAEVEGTECASDGQLDTPHAGWGRKLFRQVALLSGSASVSHLLLLACSPILARIYDREDFATFGFYQSALAIFSLILTMQYEQAIPLPKSEHDARLLRKLSLRRSALLAIAAVCLQLICQSAGILPDIWLSPWVMLALPFCSLGEAWARTYRLDAIRSARFSSLSLSRMSLSVATIFGQILLWMGGLGGLGLVLGDGLARWVSIWPLWNRNDRVNSKGNSDSDQSDVRRLAHEYSRFPWLLTPAAVLALLINMVPAFVLPVMYGEIFAGEFALANRSVLLPMLLISQAVTQVYVSEAARMVRDRQEHLPSFILRTVLQMGGIGILMAAVAAATGPRLFPVLFGAKWTGAGLIVPLLAISGFAQFVGGPVNQVLVPLRQESRKLWMHFVGACLIVVIFCGCAWTEASPMTAVTCYALSVLAIQTLYVWQSLRLAQQAVCQWKSERSAVGAVSTSEQSEGGLRTLVPAA